MASTTLVGFALGGGSPIQAKRWTKTCVFLGAITEGAISTLVVLTSTMWLLLVTSEPNVIEVAKGALAIVCLVAPLKSTYAIVDLSLVGAGKAPATMWRAVLLEWGLFLPACYLLGIYFDFGFAGIWIGFLVWRIACAIVYFRFFSRSDWSKTSI